MSHKMLRTFIVKVSVLGYFPLFPILLSPTCIRKQNSLNMKVTRIRYLSVTVVVTVHER